MKKIITMAVVLSLVAFLLLSASGCNKIGRRVAESISEETIEEAIEQGIESEGGQAEVDISEGEFTVKTEEGETTWGTGTEMPDNFPKVVPVYPDMTPTSSMTWQDSGKEYFGVSFESRDPGEKIYNWYGKEFSSGGWTIDFETSSSNEDGKFYQIIANNGTFLTMAAITEDSGGTTSVGLDVGPYE